MTANSIAYIGSYRPKQGSRAYSKAFWASEISFMGQSCCVIDAAGMNDEGQNVVKLIPYGPNSQIVDEVVADGDLLVYIRDQTQPKINIRWDKEAMLPFFKGRAFHAELCFKEDSKARHISLWDAPNPNNPTEGNPFYIRADNHALGIYRLSLKEYGIDTQREMSLKKEVRRWKTIVRPVNFPNGNALNFDPVDFADIVTLADIAIKFLRHSPSDPQPPVTFKLNCVQWCTLVLSLAFCFPLTRTVVTGLGVRQPFEQNWMSQVNGYATDNIVGLDFLPVPFYSTKEVFDNAMDLYVPDKKEALIDLAWKKAAGKMEELLGLQSDKRVIMPSAFIIENRLRNLGVKRTTKTIFEYVATALPENELTKMES